MIYNPHKYQQKVLQFGLDHPRSGWFLDMGLGKTVIALTLAEYLINQELEINKVLVIAPLKVADTTWENECKKWEHTSGLRISKVLGDLKQRVRALNTPAEIYTINRENVSWLCEYCGTVSLPFDWIIIDESSSFKNSKSERWKSLKKAIASAKRVTLLTGTPAPNGYMDIWSQIYLLDHGQRLGRFKTHFRDTFFMVDPSTIYSSYPKWILKPGAEVEIQRRISDICISLKTEDYLDLPPLVMNTVKAYMAPTQMNKYHNFVRERVMEFEQSKAEVTAASASALSNKLLQFASGHIYYEEYDGKAAKIIRRVEHIHDAKLDALEGIIDEANGQNIMVAYNFQFDETALLERFRGRGIRKLSTAQDERDWNAGKIPILLVHPASASWGLNLQQGGHIVVWYGPTWNLEQYQQLNRRLWRQGQSSPVIVHHLLTEGTEDERVMPVLEGKETVQEGLLKALELNVLMTKK